MKSFKKRWHENHVRDQFQRNALERGYKEFSDQDIIMISDIDEIPDPEKLKEFKIEKKYACFLKINFQSKLNLFNISDSDWSGRHPLRNQHNLEVRPPNEPQNAFPCIRSYLYG